MDILQLTKWNKRVIGKSLPIESQKKEKKHLKDLVREALTSSSVQYPSSLYTGISFFDKLSVEEARQALEQQQMTLGNEYRSVQAGWKEKEAAIEGDIPPWCSWFLIICLLLSDSSRISLRKH